MSEDSDVDEFSARQKEEMVTVNKRVKNRISLKPERFKDMETRRNLRPKNPVLSCLNNIEDDIQENIDDWSPFDTPHLPDHLAHLKLYCNSTVLPKTGLQDEFDNVEDDIYVVKNHVRGKLTKTNVIKDNELCPDQRFAMFKELEKWQENDVYEEVPLPDDVKLIHTRWVITPQDKSKSTEQKFKARLVCRGDMEKNDYSINSESPTASRESVKTAMAVISNHQWDIHSFDVSAAYLQGKDMERNVYIRPPKIFCPDYNKCWLLKKGVYGLKDAGRLWFEQVKKEIEDRGGTFVIGDAAFFYYFSAEQLQGVGCLYVC